jgi:hypothetical protein
MTAEQIVSHFAEAGKVETDAVEALEKLLNHDWVVSAKEAELLFKINRQIGGHDENCPTWGHLYTEAITRFLVFDLNTPGEISEEEAEWLRNHLSPENELTPNDILLLKNIHKHSQKSCASIEPLFAKAGC